MLLLSWFSLGRATTPPNLEPRLEDYFLPMRDFCFPSGMRVIVQADRSFPVVSVTAVVDGGSADGAPQEAHLSEHLWFRARPGGGPEVGEQMDAVGATWNAFTALDDRVYSTTAPPSGLATLVQLEGARLVDPLVGIAPEDAKVEGQVVMREAALRGRPLAQVAMDGLLQRMFPEGHPYAGVAHQTDRAPTWAEISAWSPQHAGPAHTTLYVAGDFPLEDGWNAVLSNLPAKVLVDPARPEAPIVLGVCGSRTAREAPPDPPAQPPALEHQAAPVDVSTLVIGWSLPAGWSADDVLHSIALGTYQGQLLYYLRRLPGVARRLQNGEYVDPLSCGLVRGAEASIVLCTIEVDPKRSPEQVLHLARTASRDLTGGDTVFEMDRFLPTAFWAYRVGVYSALEEVGIATGSRTTESAVHAHLTGSPRWFRDQITAGDAMSGKGAWEVFAKYMNPARMVAFVLDPSPTTGLAVEVDAPGSPAAIDESAVPSSDAATLRRLIGQPDLSTAEHRLPNGMRVLVVPRGTAPRVHTALVVPGGPWRAENGVAELHGDSVSWFGETRSEVLKEFIGSGYSSDRGAGTLVELSAPSGNLDAALWLLHDVLVSAHVYRPYVDDAAKSWQGLIAAHEPNQLASAAVARHLWPGVAPLDAEAASALSTIRSQEVVAWHARILDPTNVTLLIVGNVDGAEALASAEKWLGSWKGDGSPASALPSPPAPTERWTTFLTDDLAQSAEITVACELATDDDAVAHVLAAAIDRSAHRATRIATAMSYDADAGSVPVPHGQQLWFSASVSPQDAPRAIALWDHLAEQVTQGLSPANLADARLAAARAEGWRWMSVEGTVQGLAQWVMSEAPMGDRAARLAAVSARDLTGAIGGCVGHEAIAVVGPASVEATLSSAR